MKLRDFSLQKRLIFCAILVLSTSISLVVLLTIVLYNASVSKDQILWITGLSLFTILVAGSGVLIWRIRVLFRPFDALTQLCIDIREGTQSVTVCHANSREVVELKNAITSLMDTNRNLCESKVDLFKEAAHELKSPLAVMQARLSLLEMGGDLNVQKYIEETTDDIQLLNMKLKELLFVKEIEWDIFQDYAQMVSMKEECDRMQNRFDRMLQLKELTVESNWDQTFYVHTHVKVLKKVLQAIYENVFIHAKPSSTISVTIDTAHKKILIENEIDPDADSHSSTHIGMQMIERLSSKLGYTFQAKVQNDLYYTTIQFNI